MGEEVWGVGRGSRGCIGLCGEGRGRCGGRRGVGGRCTEVGRVGEVDGEW